MPKKPVLFFILLALLFQTRCVSRKSKSVVAKKPDKESLLTLPELIPYRDGELWGFADSTGKIIVQPKYNYVEGFKNGFAIVYKDRQGNIIDKNGHELLPRSFSQISVYQDFVKVGTEAKLHGLYTKTG